ncbi:FAD-dependent monooxygenase [Aequorivita sp. H23M31]|uniref:Kynurenine 3-monooxygenase n=1 Tax=Aequorivita ciconiae TaxID=2494375 RepID=A0A410FZA1_9FLAO|nr:NAD(P)/FAD-dependent oxidoreductase [Aequorivita sp. H23M31]QAA80276.1 FAD-dependent monooxygenase [Aequorivita sp. H23M31]
MSKQQNILIIGAGLCGSLLALRMAQHGFNITLVEKRPDLRKFSLDAGRSINLALSDRGLRGLRLAGVEEAAQELLIPMTGRMIHEKSGNTFLSPYSGREGEFINSVSRPGLNKLLLNEAEKMPNVKIIFNHACTEVDFDKPAATFEDFNSREKSTYSADVIFGTDGAGSVVRANMIHDKEFLLNISQQWLGHGYKELEIPATENGGYRTYKNALHIWPRGEDMLIALPNLNGSFTVTLFLPYKNSDYCFENLTTPEMVQEYFQKEFPDVLELIPSLTEEFFHNPIGAMGTVKCDPWHRFGKTLLMGDAAHAMVPFYGQGMNASFEDVAVFDEILVQYKDDLDKGNITWERIFDEYEKIRKKDADAIGELAVDNFDEMKAHTGMELFQKKRKLETAFEAEFPHEYYSKYSLVTFKEDLSYSEAKRQGRAQDKAILSLLHDNKLDEIMSLKEKLQAVKRQTQLILNESETADYLKF